MSLNTAGQVFSGPETGSLDTSNACALSVIVSVRNSASTLRECLASIQRSELGRDSYELIVVDDASTDGSVAIAARYADTIVKLSNRPCGPGYARNRGVEVARAPLIAFVDADVSLRPQTLTDLMEILSKHPEVDAVSASHSEHSSARNFVSQYWNLLLRFGEQAHGGRCAQFAPGCGVVRRSAFLAAGMYDEWRFATATMENAELGERLLRSGHEMLLRTETNVTQLRKWSFRTICREVWSRGQVLSRSLGYSRIHATAPGEVIFTLSRTLTPAFALLGTLLLAAAFVPAPSVISKSGLALAVLLLTNLPVHRFYATTKGLAFAIVSAPVHILVQLIAAMGLCTGWILRDLLGDVSPDATTQAYFEVGLEIWPPVPRKR